MPEPLDQSLSMKKMLLFLLESQSNDHKESHNDNKTNPQKAQSDATLPYDNRHNDHNEK